MKTKSLAPIQISGATIAIVGGAIYGKAREAAEMQQKEEKAMVSEETPLKDKMGKAEVWIWE